MSVVASYSQMTLSYVKKTYSGGTKTVTPLVLMAACPAMGSGVKDPYKSACIHGTTSCLASLTPLCSPVQTSQIR